MKLLINLILTMSACGTLPFLLYMVAVLLFDSRFTCAFRYRVLKLCLAFYLIPFPLFKHLLAHSLGLASTGVRLNHYYFMEDTILKNGNEFFVQITDFNSL